MALSSDYDVARCVVPLNDEQVNHELGYLDALMKLRRLIAEGVLTTQAGISRYLEREVDRHDIAKGPDGSWRYVSL
jgi:hypothetical protein